MKKIFLTVKIAIYVLVPIVLLLLPADFFDSGTTLCISKRWLNIECYACGLTRGIMHLIHLDFAGAYYYNVLSFVVFPLLSFLWLTWFLRDAKTLRYLSKT